MKIPGPPIGHLRRSAVSACPMRPRGRRGSVRDGPEPGRGSAPMSGGRLPPSLPLPPARPEELPTMSVHPATAAFPDRARPAPLAATGRPGDVGHVLVFAALSVALAAAATYGGVAPALVPFVMAFGP